MVAELVRFMREVVREMGEERAVGFLRKFYGWYLRGVDGARELRGALTQAPSVELAEAILLEACPEAAPLLARARGRDRAAARHARPTACSTCRSRSTAAADDSRVPGSVPGTSTLHQEALRVQAGAWLGAWLAERDGHQR